MTPAATTPGPAAPTSPSRRRLAAALAAALAALAPTVAHGGDPLPVEALSARSGRLVASVDLGPAFPTEVLDELGNGLSNVVSIWIAVLPAGGGEPVALYGRLVEVLFDVWEETYTVELKDPRTPAGRTLVVQSTAGLRTLLAAGRDLDLGPLADLPRGRFVVQATIELNPISKEQLERTREYIATAGPRSGGSRSVLGAMAGALLREPPPGADVHVLRSRAFTAAEVVK